MVEKLSKKRKRCSTSEEDTFLLLQRYTTSTVLGLLQEVAHCSGGKIDWNALVKKTRTDISNAREYQMLWQHLAYGHALIDTTDDSVEPVDDESDLECELEIVPPVNNEMLMEASAFVKVLSASYIQNTSGIQNSSTIEAPLFINIPTSGEQHSTTASDTLQHSFSEGKNVVIPVYVSKQPIPLSTVAEGLEGSGPGGTLTARKKRKPWSESEDIELIAAVQKCGEGNWANIVKGDFKGDRTASQLSQRWAILRKRYSNLDVGVADINGSHISEVQLAARRAVMMALDVQPDKRHSSISPSFCTPSLQNEASTPSLHGKTALRPQPMTKKVTPDDMVKVAAVAAGARIATREDASSLIKSANNVHHITAHRTATASPAFKSSALRPQPSNRPLNTPPSGKQCATVSTASVEEVKEVVMEKKVVAG